ncbi:Mediator of RNA polymerase II transcription subunit 8 [Penicillium rolfsii]|nr:Mediator of RNA polymerase II transcription subunit 8 [Penicillium rolfsii]
MTTLTSEEYKVLEQSRQRLVQLTRSLGSLVASLEQGDPLPPWSSLQSQASIISNNLSSVTDHLSDHRDLLSSIVAYPGPEYPGRTQESMLQQLLRTKLDPRVEDWVARGRTAGTVPSQSELGSTSAISNPSGRATTKQLSESELTELWNWAPIEANQEARQRNWGGNYTLEEREAGIENVVTGLRRQLEDDDASEDEEEGDEDEGEDEMDVVGVHRKSGGGFEFDIAPHHAHAVTPVVPLDQILRYMTTGHMP